MVSILRLAALIYAPPLYYAPWAGLPIAVWTGVEVNLALTCSCLPPLRPLFTRLWRKMNLHNNSLKNWSFSYLPSSIWGKSRSSKADDSQKSTSTTAMTTTTTITVTKEGEEVGEAEEIARKSPLQHHYHHYQQQQQQQQHPNDVFTGTSMRDNLQPHITGGQAKPASSWFEK